MEKIPLGTKERGNGTGTASVVRDKYGGGDRGEEDKWAKWRYLMHLCWQKRLRMNVVVRNLGW